MDEMERLGAVLDRAVDAGAERALESFREELAVETKEGPLDAVTAVDRASQSAVAEVVDGSVDGPLVGEEADAVKSVPETGPAWVVDPIDGTLNYAVGNRTWGTCLALVEDAEPVAAVNSFPAMADRVRATDGGTTRNGEPVAPSDTAAVDSFVVGTVFGYTTAHREAFAAAAARIIDACGDLRRVGSGQATLTMVATGELDAAVSTVSLPPWDTLAGVHLIRRAGGRVTDLAGEPWRHDADSLVASNGVAHDELLEAIRS